MAFYTLERARPLGAGKQAPGGSVTDGDLIASLRNWKRTVAGSYRSLTPGDLVKWLPSGPYQVSPKIDGELWFLVLEHGDAALVNPAGRVLVGDIPVLVEAKAAAARAVGRTILCGELFAAGGKGRPRVGEVSEAMGGEEAAQVQKLGFRAFDLYQGGDAATPVRPDLWVDRYEVLKRMLAGGKRLDVIPNETLQTVEEVQARFAEKVEGGKGEGLVIRLIDGRIYKVKPEIHLDAVVIGYAVRGEDPTQIRSFAVAMVREDGNFQLVGSLGNLGNERSRRELLELVKGLDCDSKFRYASSEGALYQFIRPEVVVELRVTDLQPEESDGAPVKRMALAFGESGWTPLRMMPAPALLHPVFERVRTDKSVNTLDVRFGQVLERCLVHDAHAAAVAVERSASAVVYRAVYTKVTKEKTAVRKLVAWKTNKEEVDPAYPAYVVHFTDYSPGRAEPLDRTVRLAPDADAAKQVISLLLEENIKKGWVAGDRFMAPGWE